MIARSGSKKVAQDISFPMHIEGSYQPSENQGLTRDELIALLGKSENYNGRDKQLFYPIIQHYTPPVRAKWLIIQLDVDNELDEFQMVDSNNIKSC